MRLYTKGGDDGTTSLSGGKRVGKADIRVSAYGEVDEINALIGSVIATCRDEETVASLRLIQSDLFLVGTELATPDSGKPKARIGETHVAGLERLIDAACDEVEPLSQFVLPGGSQTAAALHVARTVCRRAERTVVALSQRESVNRLAVVYLNRLGDFLFALARRTNHREGAKEIPWIAPKR